MQNQVLDYESPCPTYALAFSPSAPSSGGKQSVASPSSRRSPLKFAVGSYVEAFSENHITVVGLDRDPDVVMNEPWDMMYDPQRAPPQPNFVSLARAQHPYPCTALDFSPPSLSSRSSREMIATTSDSLRLWDFINEPFDDDPTVVSSSPHERLVSRSNLANSKADFSAPLTSFSWSAIEPRLIVTSSIDTTCTVWDISASSAVTQLIAHDREVYDVAWSPTSSDIFASVGADGSVRLFDLRSLEQSTILYEAMHPPPPRGGGSSATKDNNKLDIDKTYPNGNGTSNTSQPSTPLLRLSFNPSDSNYLAINHMDDSSILILDIRSPGSPVSELRAHNAPVNGIKWGPSGMIMTSCGDDCQVLVWDLQMASASRTHSPLISSKNAGASGNSNVMARHIKDPIMAHTAPSEVNSVRWNDTGEWVGFTAGKLVRCLRTS